MLLGLYYFITFLIVPIQPPGCNIAINVSYVTHWLFWEKITASHVIVCCYQLIIQMYTVLLRWWLNLTLQISQGSASTYSRWSGQFGHSFVEGLFRDNPSNSYWNRFRLHLTDLEQNRSRHSFLRHGVVSQEHIIKPSCDVNVLSITR